VRLVAQRLRLAVVRTRGRGHRWLALLLLLLTRRVVLVQLGVVVRQVERRVGMQAQAGGAVGGTVAAVAAARVVLMLLLVLRRLVGMVVLVVQRQLLAVQVVRVAESLVGLLLLLLLLLMMHRRRQLAEVVRSAAGAQVSLQGMSEREAGERQVRGQTFHHIADGAGLLRCLNLCKITKIMDRISSISHSL